jgi:hypothetical protein
MNEDYWVLAFLLVALIAFAIGAILGKLTK